MKKLFTLIVVVGLGAFSFQSHAQCTPDPNADTLITPTPGALTDAELNQAYSEVITLNVPADTTVPFLGTVPIDSAAISGITGLPPGLTFQCNPNSCTFPGGTLGCILISGTVTDASLIGTNYPLSATLDVYANIPGSPVSQAITGYSILVVGSTIGTKELNGNAAFSLLSNTPNPFHSQTSISFNTPEQSAFEFRVLNMLGEEVFAQKVQADAGLNSFSFDGSYLPAGFYLYTLSNGKYSSGSRMIISDH